VTHLSFSNTPHGIPGNEDYGAMASWVAFASLGTNVGVTHLILQGLVIFYGFYFLGLFPQAGTTNYLIGSPRVDRASLKLKHFRGDYSSLDIVTYDNSAENVYVSRLLVNGVEHNTPFIDRSVLVADGGCKLEFYMSSVPQSGLCSAAAK
jgi:putative alpha-1,2-mannosidase